MSSEGVNKLKVRIQNLIINTKQELKLSNDASEKKFLIWKTQFLQELKNYLKTLPYPCSIWVRRAC